MDDHQVGAAIRSIRQRKRWRQEDLATKARVSRSTVGRIERGALSNVPLGTIRMVALALDARIDTYVRWQGGDLTRMINSRHAAMHEEVARIFAELGGWVAEPEVSFSVYGERGVIDVVAWHPGSRSMLLVELKTELVDISELMGTLDRKRRLSAEVARERRWDAVSTSAWVIVADSRTNRRALSNHALVVRSKLPADGRTIRAWLRQPVGSVNALSFLPSARDPGIRRGLAPVRRVRRGNPTRTRACLPGGSAVSRPQLVG
jgi:transcriptional regulator with XRE-family HTH domain